MIVLNVLFKVYVYDYVYVLYGWLKLIGMFNLKKIIEIVYFE